MAPQDSFIDDEEETCPLCVEEFDLSDKNFRPCPCGYQICQFCFNNIKTNLNALCPACRRPYDEKTIEWKVVSPEEQAQFRANIQKNAKKKAEQRQKEAQKREVENLNRKHLSGLRVVQRNLVYVVGLNPHIPEKDLLGTLRGEEYFGQYGKILKIVVSKSKSGESPQNSQGLGVYVTFARKEDAQRCIAAVNGSQNGDRVLRAQLGTTKYCSAFLRGETCTNKQCMFLHEDGDNDDSYSRQDLSSLNSVNTQRPLQSIASSSASSSRQIAQMQAPIQQSQPVAAASQPMMRESSKDGSDSGDGSALPSSASWANRGVQQQSRRGSHATSGATSSPAVSQAIPATAEIVEEDPEVVPEPSQPQSTSENVSAGPPKPERDPILLNLLKSINEPDLLFSVPTSLQEHGASFPPLFDAFGGEKRAARKQQLQEEEARLRLEEESVEEEQVISEPVEEDEPESGSYQLGGEPEDRDGHREVPTFQRQSSAQLPIQRTHNGPVGAPGNFPRNLTNLNSINGRAMTPQQQQLMLSTSLHQQSSFMDQYSPSIGSQSTQNSSLFQQQGHNRQSSRYNFATDNSSKPLANSKMMAQQASMMPSHQGSNQFYGSSIQGPPPGLKSTGTPPIGGMFGQGHAFGGSMGAAFGAKENSNEMLREMLRARGANIGGGQSHDTGKREFMFPNFNQSYPSTSSTPAPASSSGLVASLYAPQSGSAFHDYSQKQKKKGKKHRHANTSSSGGGGLVDLVDPSILQARMPHQQQSNAGVGQGLFGGQAQDDQNLPFPDEATLSVDALVADSIADSTADNFGMRLSDVYEMVNSRSSTPTVPPGFSLPHAHPQPQSQEPAIKPPSRIVPSAAPFTPSRSSSFIPRTATPLSNVVTPEILKKPLAESSASQAKKDVKALATNTGLSKAIVSQASQSLQSEDFPALTSGTAKAPATPTASKASAAKPPVTPAIKKTTAVTTPGPSTTLATAPKSEKRTQPGILNISVPSKPAVKPVPVVETPSKPMIATSAFPPLPPSTPSVSAAQSPLTRNTPKTLRLVPSKVEKPDTPTTGNATPSSVTSVVPPPGPTRQASLASISRHERPGTPTSEAISDNASVTSASISRASSPPPSKVGSAPVRTTTKSMQKKQRQLEKQRSEAEAAAIAAAAKAEPEVIAPIMGRKRKQQKDKHNIHSAAGGSTPAQSRPASPGPVDRVQEESSKHSDKNDSNLNEKAKTTAVESEAEVTKPSIKSKGKNKQRGQQHVPPPPTVEPAHEAEEEAEQSAVDSSKPPTVPTPATILEELIADEEIPDANHLAFLKPPLSSVKLSSPAEAESQGPLQKLIITPEDRATLSDGKPVHKNRGTAHPTMLTPNGDYLRYLTPEEEERYLTLQEKLAEDAGPSAFVSAKHHASNGFTLIGGRAVPNGPPSFFPTPKSNGVTLDPVSKIQRDEALSYINQYVLPSLSTNSQLEKALNANALDAEMLRSADPSSFPSWGSDPGGPRAGSSHDGSGQEGILATGLEGMTAHFAVGRDGDSGRPLGNVSLLSLPDAETGMQAARKEAEIIEKKLHALVKKNRRILLGSGH
ncbi:RING/U-box [Glarea lozoyensis ATCC 20868]|uniref:RING/U-box n=1 Tax=Glarea lozoyensis (strain ATCC 20868 / MF5171) TaxID=1116229 RepID=S3CLQ0_GLAL2|nr:RING/U-box [Glarea lozoyensis ATCC 20868]EPE26655.1 RING/U-box [Glarea lozoyensis ATCC 20868]